MNRIMFVCHGNICRSPMAEFILKDIVKSAGKEEDFLIASSATSTEEIGNPVYPPARRELLLHGIDPGKKRSVRLTPDDYDKYDMFFVMDSNNYKNIFKIFADDPKGKVRKLLDLTVGGDVADPWYTGDFELTFSQCLAACKALFESLEK